MAYSQSLVRRLRVFAWRWRRRWRAVTGSLSAKLLMLVLVFIMLAEILIFVPSVANFRKNWLMERLAAAQIASLAVEAAPNNDLPERLQKELLQNARVFAVALKRNDTRRLVLQAKMPEKITHHFDLRHASWFTLILDALDTFFATDDSYIRVIGKPEMGAGDFIEIVIAEAPLRAAMIRFSLNILLLSLVISLITAALVYFALNRLFVRPMQRLTHNMVAFSQNPEDKSRIIQPSDRRDEIGIAERKLASLQAQTTQMLHQKNRLAALGLAVSKINHDLRNMLASAQLISDHLGTIDNPAIQRLSPKLVSSLDRAIRLCTDTLKYGRSQEAPPKRTLFPLWDLAQEVGESLGLPKSGLIDWQVHMPRDLQIDADRDQLFRILSNLVRNACEALVADQKLRGITGEDYIKVTAKRRGSQVILEVSDTGPGIPPKARAHLFEAFQGSARQGGTGLGLAISAELVAAHGGTISLRDTQVGATFRIVIPDRATVVETPRRRLA